MIVASPGLVQDYEAGHLTGTQVAAALGCAVPMAYQALRRAGATIRKAGRPCHSTTESRAEMRRPGRLPLVISEADLAEYRQHMDVGRLAEKIGYRVFTTRRALQRQGERILTMKERYQNPTAKMLRASMGMKRERNAAIYEAFQAGRSSGLLADEHGISKQAVHQIVARVARQRGETVRHRTECTERDQTRFAVQIPQEVSDSVMAGTLSSKDAAARLGVTSGYLLRRLETQGIYVGEARFTRSRDRGAEMYEKFIAGAKLPELAREYETSEGNVCQMIQRHRRRHGLPGKRSTPHSTKGLSREEGMAQADAYGRELYEKNLEGATAEELGREYGKTPQNIFQHIAHYRKKYGLPRKKESANGHA
jgi:Mor family transcriptional regulator/DNA-binding CsgD family transcriptional regulator